MSTAARIGGLLGALAAFTAATTRGGLATWAAGALTVGGLILAAAILFVPSETPARRLRGLIQAWQSPQARAAGPEPSQHPAASPAQDEV